MGAFPRGCLTLRGKSYSRPTEKTEPQKSRHAVETWRLMRGSACGAGMVLMRDSGHRSLKHCWSGTASLDHPKLIAARLDEYVEAWTARKCERAGAVFLQRIGSLRSAGTHDGAIDADGSERTDKRTVVREVDSFNDSFRYRDASGDVPAMRGEDVGATESVRTAVRHGSVLLPRSR